MNIPNTMQAVTVREIGSFDLGLREVRLPEQSEVIVKVSVTGLCRTDLKIIRTGHRDLILPRIPGEEVVGVVYAVGDAVSGYSIGDRVYVYPGQWCGCCPACISGAENLCRQMKITGFHRDGGFAEFVTVPSQSLIHIPRDLPDEIAVFAEPLSCCLNALELSGLSRSERIAIWGGGPAGTLLARGASAMGASSIIIDPDPRRASLAAGVSVPPDEVFDVCIVATGDASAYLEAVQRLAPRGRLILFSGLSKSECILPVDFNQLHYMEQTLVGAYGCCYRHGMTALEMLVSGAVRVEDMISHRMPLSMLAEALELLQNRTGMKIHLYPTGD